MVGLALANHVDSAKVRNTALANHADPGMSGWDTQVSGSAEQRSGGKVLESHKMSTGGVHESEAWRMSTYTTEMSCGEVLGCYQSTLCRSISLYGMDVPPLGYMFPYLVLEVVPVELIINQCVRLLIKGSPRVWLGVAFCNESDLS